MRSRQGTNQHCRSGCSSRSPAGDTTGGGQGGAADNPASPLGGCVVAPALSPCAGEAAGASSSSSRSSSPCPINFEALGGKGPASDARISLFLVLLRSLSPLPSSKPWNSGPHGFNLFIFCYSFLLFFFIFLSFWGLTLTPVTAFSPLTPCLVPEP